MPDQIIAVTCQTCKREYQINLDELRAEQTIFKTVYRGEMEELRAKCPRCGHYNVVTIERRSSRGG